MRPERRKAERCEAEECERQHADHLEIRQKLHRKQGLLLQEKITGSAVRLAAVILSRSAWCPPNTVNAPAVWKGRTLMKMKMLLAGLACALLTTSAQAACDDPPGGPDLNWSGCNKRGAVLNYANLGGANLQNTRLQNARLQGVNLGGANLAGAKLQGANLAGARLIGANMTGAIVSPETVWTSGNPCKGSTVDTCRVNGPKPR